MGPIPNLGPRLALHPTEMPGLVTFWDFQSPAPECVASGGEPYVLVEGNGSIARVPDEAAPFGEVAAELREGQWWSAPRAAVPRLDFHGPTGHFTLIAWIRRARTAFNHCEFVAGQWNETNRGRQYGLFLNIHMWNSHHEICGHVSRVGGPTPGYRYCMDGAMGATAVGWDEWHSVAMSYDGTQAWAWLDGVWDARPGLNPYLMPGGLHDGGPHGSDFTVGAVHRRGEMGNFFAGRIGGLAVYDRALTPAEMFAVAAPPTPAPATPAAP